MALATLMEFAIVECALNMILDIVHIYLELLKLATGLVNEVQNKQCNKYKYKYN